jgi:hypothetical protein
MLCPYPYQYEAIFISILILLTVGLPTYGIYKLVIWKMNIRTKTIFHKILLFTVIFITTLFFMEITVSIITIHHVNKQLGFAYATPDTPEGELFEIQKVVPGKTMDKAGLKPLDQIEFRSVNQLYLLLINNQGKVVEIPIKRDSEKMLIKVKVPELDVPLARVSFLF